jgi:RNA polymerase sigma factor (sigma-70 family)
MDISPRFPELLLRSQTDERLAILAGRGHERAFAVLVERYQPALLGFARNATGPERAEDVVQQALTQAWVALQQGTEVRHFRGWIYQIVRYASWKATSQASTDGELDPALAGAETLHTTVESRMQLRRVVDGLGGLPNQQRIALVQTELEGRSRSEIAATLGVSEGAVRQLVYRGREQLRRAVAGVVPLPVLSWALRGGDRVSLAQRASDLAWRAADAPAMLQGATKVFVGLLATGTVAVAGASAVGLPHTGPSTSAGDRAAATGSTAGAQARLVDVRATLPGASQAKAARQLAVAQAASPAARTDHAASTPPPASAGSGAATAGADKPAGAVDPAPPATPAAGSDGDPHATPAPSGPSGHADQQHAAPDSTPDAPGASGSDAPADSPSSATSPDPTPSTADEPPAASASGDASVDSSP